MTPIDARMIADLDAAEALATKGPWEAVPHVLYFRDCILPEQVWSRETLKRVAFTETHAGQDTAADAAFIVAARNALPRLLALIAEQAVDLQAAAKGCLSMARVVEAHKAALALADAELQRLQAIVSHDEDFDNIARTRKAMIVKAVTP